MPGGDITINKNESTSNIDRRRSDDHGFPIQSADYALYFNILKLDASPKKPYSAPMVHRRLKELGIGLDRKTVFNHMRILTDQMLSAEQDGDSFFRQYLCSKLYRCRKEEQRKC